MSRKKELQRQLGRRYSYERLLNDREILRIKRQIPADFSETTAAVLTAGCLRLDAVLYLSCKELLLGYDVFVKDDPDSPEWIYYDGLSDPVSLKESNMIRILDRMVLEHGLSYTESCFKRLDGKTVEKDKNRL
ncbi:MAG: hypothetical protein KHW87_00875 [Clostridiales bacterium]|nr:hypothetical protein [Clostridiales bacterium]